MKSPTIKITEQELYEVCHKIVQGEWLKRNDFSPAVNVKEEVRHHFRLMSSIEKKPARWIHRKSRNLFLFAAASFFALAIKIFCENFWRFH